MNAHMHHEPFLTTDLRALGLDVVELEWAPGVWQSPCPACIAAGSPEEPRLRHVQVSVGEPFELICANGCSYLQIVEALEQLVRELLSAGDCQAAA